jgi:hypothetical protein
MMKNSTILEKCADCCATFALRALAVLWLLFITAALFATPVSGGSASLLFINDFLFLPKAAFIIAGANLFLQLLLIKIKVSAAASRFAILPVFFFAVSFFLMYFSFKYGYGFQIFGAVWPSQTSICFAAFLFSAFITLFYFTLGICSSKVRTADLLLYTVEKENCCWNDEGTIKEDCLFVKYKKKKNGIIELKEISGKAKDIFIKWASAAVMLFIAVKLTPAIYAPLPFFLAAAFIMDVLNHIAQTLIKSEYYNFEVNDAGQICGWIFKEYFVFAVCAHLLFFAGKSVQGVYVKDLAAAYTGGFIFYILRLLFLFFMHILKSQRGKQRLQKN